MRSLPARIFGDEAVNDEDQQDPQTVREILQNLTGPQGIAYAAPLVGQGVAAPAQTALLPTQVYNTTPQEAMVGPQESVGSSNTIRDLYRSYLQGPQQTPLPEPPRPTVGGAFKHWGLNMIPGYRQMDTERRAWEQNQALLANQNAMQRWQQTGEMVKPLLTRDMDLENKLFNQEANLRFLVQNGVQRTEAAIYSVGRTPAQPLHPKASEPVQIEMPDGTRLQAYYQENEKGIPGYYNMADHSQIPVVQGMRIYRQTEPTQQDKQWEDTKRMYEALYKQKHQIAEQQPLSEAQSAQAQIDFDKAKQPPPGFAIIQSPDAQGNNQQWFVNPHNPNAPATPVTLPGGEQAPSKASEVPAQLKVQATSAWNALRQAENAIKIIDQNPDLVGPVAGRVETFFMGVGAIPGIAPGKEQIASQLAAHLNYLFAQELRTMFPGRTNQWVMEMIKKTSAQIHQDPSMLHGFLDALKFNANMVLHNPGLSGWSPVDEMVGGGASEPDIPIGTIKHGSQGDYEYLGGGQFDQTHWKKVVKK